MDSFEKRLRQDADAIRAEPSPAFVARLDASLNAVDAERIDRAGTDPVQRSMRWWWLASLTGGAAVLLLVATLDRQPLPEDVPSAVATTATPSPADAPPPILIPLETRTADFTAPLAEELENLKSDLDKARESVGKELPFTF